MEAAWVAKLPLGRELPCGAVGLMSDFHEQEINCYVLSHGDLESFVTAAYACPILPPKRSMGCMCNSWGAYRVP